MKLAFKTINCSANYNHISWEVLDHKINNILGYNVYFSENGEHTFNKQNERTLDNTEYYHKLANYTATKKGFYKIGVVFSNETEELFGPYDIHILDIDKFSKNILKRQSWNLTYPTLPLTIIMLCFHLRFNGKPCPSCGVTDRLGNIKSKCPVCYGTGYEKGYYVPTLVGMDQSTITTVSKNDSGIGTTETSLNQHNTTSLFGYFRYGDVFREIKYPYRTWVINSLSYTDATGLPLTYTLGFQEADSGHPLNMIKVPDLSWIFSEKLTYLNFYDDWRKLKNKYNEYIKNTDIYNNFSQ